MHFLSRAIFVTAIHCFLVCAATTHGQTSASRPASTYRVQQGDTLHALGAKFYGSSHFRELIALHNHINIETADKLRIGTQLHVPPLAEVLTREGLRKVADKEVDLIAEAYAIFHAHREAVKNAARTSRVGDRFTLPADEAKALRAAAEKLEAAARGLGESRPGIKSTPKRTIGQIRSAAGYMKSLADNRVDENGYDIDMVDQSFVRACVYSIKWARNGFD